MKFHLISLYFIHDSYTRMKQPTFFRTGCVGLLVLFAEICENKDIEKLKFKLA